MPQMLFMDRVSKRYDSGQEALSDVTLRVDQGEMVFVTGHSGAGKSTLLKLIALMERPNKGRVVVGQTDLAKLAARHVPLHRRRIGVIFQDHRLLADRSVFDNVALPLVVSGYARRDIGRRVRAALDKVGLLNREQQFPVALSTGEQQRVGIARAVVHKPPLLLADEPTGNLDPDLSREIMHLFEAFNQVGVTVLVASHDLGLIKRLAHRTIRLEHGRVT
jgi:cell division transport system ATP-binding protein